jgi:hypothetical protein
MDFGLTTPNSRQQLIRAAALGLLIDEKTGIEIAGVQTANFVQTVRKSYRASGFNFSDADIREIHHTLRCLIVERGLKVQANAGH